MLKFYNGLQELYQAHLPVVITFPYTSNPKFAAGYVCPFLSEDVH
jgi:hypothetical protein